VVKTSLLIMVALTILIRMGLRWREERMAAVRPAAKGPRLGWIAAQKRELNVWVTAAALAALATIVLLGGLHWARQISGGW
jgi:hypothetical protein